MTQMSQMVRIEREHPQITQIPQISSGPGRLNHSPILPTEVRVSL